MTDYVIFTDAGADIPAELCARYEIHGIPMSYLLAGESGTFRPEAPDRSALCGAFYDALRRQAEVSTSQINPFAFEEIFAPVLSAGQDILYCCFSSGLSATWQSAQTAAAQLREQFPERTVRCVDSLSAAGGQGILVLQAAINREKGLSLEENARWLETHTQHLCHWFTVDDLDFLKRGGRISPTAAFLGGKLQIKPMLIIEADGKLKVAEKARGRKAAVSRLIQLYQQTLDFSGVEPVVFVGHAGAPEDGAALAEQIQAVSPAGVQVVLTELSPIIGAHTGPNMLYVAHFGKTR
jgi:DegV family protein with EDD domain